MQATQKAELNLTPLLSTGANIAHILPHLQSVALISIRKLFDDGCIATFTDTDMTVNKQGEVVLEVNHNGESVMRHVGPTLTHQSANTLMADRNKPVLAQWYHATLFSPFN